MFAEEQTIKLTVDELAERWKWLFDEAGVERLLITECFSVRKIHEYEVTGLSMEFENGHIMCNDLNGGLIRNLSVLLLFLRKNLNTILLLPIGNDLFREKLIFNDGVIYIEKVT